MKQISFALFLFVSFSLAQPQTLRVNAERIEQRILKLAEFGGTDAGNMRVAYSEADLKGRDYVIRLMKDAGMAVRIDAAGNIVGRRDGSDPKLPVILFGSHIDAVPRGGNYDGDVGVLGAIECVQVLHENRIRTRHPLEVVVFSNEEGGLVGSRSMIGTLPEEALDVVSHSRKTIREGIRFVGGNPGQLNSAARKKGEIKAFIELHIEQGATLHEEKVNIGVVEGIVGIKWWDVTIEGFANHAGTTPMNRRKDALLAASHLISAVNRIVTGEPGKHVGTVGRIFVEPGAPNVIPGRAVMSLELRDLSAETIDMLFDRIAAEAKAIERQSGTTILFSLLEPTSIPAPTDEQIRLLIAEAATSLKLNHKLMPSGAGHDTQNLAKIAPSGMIFVPSVDGISHSPKEFTHPHDMANGANVLLQTILRIDAGALDAK